MDGWYSEGELESNCRRQYWAGFLFGFLAGVGAVIAYELLGMVEWLIRG